MLCKGDAGVFTNSRIRLNARIYGKVIRGPFCLMSRSAIISGELVEGARGGYESVLIDLASKMFVRKVLPRGHM